MASESAEIRLADVVTLERGSTYKSALIGQPGPVLLGLATIQRNGGFRSDSLRTYGGLSPTRMLLHPGDLFVSLKDVTQSADLLGAVARVPADVSVGRLTQDTAKLVPSGCNYPLDLLYWALRSPQYRSYCRERATGTTNLGLDRNDFLAYSLPEPTPERLSLVTLLDAIEAREALLAATIATVESAAQALFKSWFVDFDPVRAKAEGREPEAMDADTAALFPNEFEESALGPIPKGWRLRRLGDLLELAYGRALKASERVRGGVPVYGSGGIIGYHNTALLDEPTIIVGRKGTVGSLFWEDRPCFPIDTVFFVRKAKAPLSFLSEAMRRLGLERMNTDAAVPGLNRDNAYRLPVVVPPAEILERWEALVGLVRARVARNRSHTAILEQVRNTLLPRLISGKLRIPDAERAAAAAGA